VAPQCDDLVRDGRAITVAAALQPKSSLFANTGEFGHFGSSAVLRGPNLNAYSERSVRSVRVECLSKFILFGERSLRRAMREYVAHYHAE
jgi:hypothetical protein